MREAEEQARENERLSRYYRRMHLNNLINRAEALPNNHLARQAYLILTPMPPWMATQQENQQMMISHTVVRHRMSKEIAEELLAVRGAFAHYDALEKLANDTHHPQLWHDVLAWLDEMEKPHGRVDTDDERPREEPTNHTDDDS